MFSVYWSNLSVALSLALIHFFLIHYSMFASWKVLGVKGVLWKVTR